MSMADNNELRFDRSNNPYRHTAVPADAGAPRSGSDPLAELARLVGQTDPFAELDQSNPRGAEPRRAAASDARRNALPSGSSGYQRRDPYEMASGGGLLPEPGAD